MKHLLITTIAAVLLVGVVGCGREPRLDIWQASEAGIVSLSCNRQYHPSQHFKAFSPRGITLRNGTTRPTYDLILYPRK